MTDDRYGAAPAVPYLSIPVSEFENLHEDNRLLREKIEKISQLAKEYEAIARGSVAEARRWRTVVAAVHGDVGGHRNPYLECPNALCLAARMGSRD